MPEREEFPLLRKRLDADKCDMTTADFIETVCTCFVNLYHGSGSDEDLLHEPRKAIEFCQEVRKRIGAKVCDRTILRTLTNTRKRERFDFDRE
jgi:hypothetical protein